MIKEIIIEEMKKVFYERPGGIEHTLNVLKNAEDIMDGEGIEGDLRELISIAVILHDIGIVSALKKYGSSKAEYQEKEGYEISRAILNHTGYVKHAERISYIIGNHHTQSKIDGIDFRILWEADLLENMKGRDTVKEQKEITDVIAHNFQTVTGKNMACKRFMNI